MKPADPKLIAIFRAEQQEHLERIRGLLETARGSAPEAAAALEEVLRRAHTWKGAARAVGIEATERVAHRLEAVFAGVREGALQLDRSLTEAVERALESAEDALDGVLSGAVPAAISGAAEALENALRAAPVRPAGGTGDRSLPAPSSALAHDISHVRADARSIDDLVRSSGELVGFSARQGRAAEDMEGVVQAIAGMEREWMEWRRQPAGPGSSEGLNQFGAHLHAATAAARACATAGKRNAWTLGQLAAQVHYDACRVRMTPAEVVFGGFRKMVRDLAREAGKEVDFRVEGFEIEADRLVLQALKDPVMHLLRNAISHGIEPPLERAAAGKSASGLIRLRLESRGDRLSIAVEDDGRGIDFRKVAEVAVNAGLIASEAAASQTPEELAGFVLLPGFSTAQAVTTLAGRGMGLSVVREQVVRLRGDVQLRDAGAPGARFLLSVPLSISTQRVLLVACGGQTLAIPTHVVERLYRIARDAVESVEGRQAFRLDGRPVFLANLADVLGIAGAPDGAQAVSLVVLRSGGERAGFVVDALLDEREAIVKDLGAPPAVAGLCGGGIALEDGWVAPLLDPAALFERYRRVRAAPAAVPPARAEPGAPAIPSPAQPATILVVDDSITTRSLEKNLLEAHGYHVRVAVDGLEALARLREEPAGLVIADISMPRMNGFELLERMKADKKLAGIPVIVVTSMERREDQERGLALGADAYIVKRKFDQRELLETVRQIL